MDFDRLYYLGEEFLRGALRVRPREDPDDEFALARAEKLPRRPMVFDHAEGGKPRDLVGTTLPPLQLVSDRFVELLQENRFTGWTTYPVEVYGKGGIRVKGLHGFAVTGRCGPIDNSRSARVWRDPPVPGGKRARIWLGLYFDPESWDGSDIFVPAGTGLTIVVEAVKQAAARAKLRNVSFCRLTEFERLML